MSYAVSHGGPRARSGEEWRAECRCYHKHQTKQVYVWTIERSNSFIDEAIMLTRDRKNDNKHRITING